MLSSYWVLDKVCRHEDSTSGDDAMRGDRRNDDDGDERMPHIARCGPGHGVRTDA